MKDSNLDAHVRVDIKANGEIEDAKNINLFSCALRDIIFNYVTITWETT